MKTACPHCGSDGRQVRPITVESLVQARTLSRLEGTAGFCFCAESSCDIAYFHSERDEIILKDAVRVRIGQKETASPRPLCYCFEHTVEQIEADVAADGTSRIPAEITARCKAGLDRCEETNPQGCCCLGNVRKALLGAQDRLGIPSTSRPSPDEPAAKVKAGGRLNPGMLVQLGALASAIAASACCWLPLLLVGLGISGGTLAASISAWRPVLLPITFAMLGLAFYLTYRRPRSKAATLAGEAQDCCSTESAGDACCESGNGGGVTIRRFNKVMLWVMTVFILGFTFFPDAVGYFLGDDDSLAARSDLETVIVNIEGMTCAACAATLDNTLLDIDGVADVDVDFEAQQAVVGILKGTRVPRESILAAIADAGYSGRFNDQQP